jgi:outer membrane biosynthesis protein TonB
MRFRAIIAVSSLLWLCLGCESKRLKEPLPLAKLPELAYPVVLPPEEPAPAPAMTAENIPTIPQAPPSTQPAKPRKPRPSKTITDKPASGNNNTPPAPATQEGPNQKIVISPGAETTQNIAASSPHTDELHHRQTTAQLLQSTEDNLRLASNPNSDQQAIIAQIRTFLSQARQAQAENDPVRAHNLALKAHLLSDELVRR